MDTKLSFVIMTHDLLGMGHIYDIYTDIDRYRYICLSPFVSPFSAASLSLFIILSIIYHVSMCKCMHACACVCLREIARERERERDSERERVNLTVCFLCYK